MKRRIHAYFDHIHIQREEVGIHLVATSQKRETRILDESRFGDSGKGVVVIIEKFIACKIQNRHRKKWLFPKEDSTTRDLIGRTDSVCFSNSLGGELPLDSNLDKQLLPNKHSKQKVASSKSRLARFQKLEWPKWGRHSRGRNGCWRPFQTK